MRKISKKGLGHKLDTAWGLYIRDRANNLCEVCGQPGNNPHHIEGRRNMALRWAPENGVCLCSGCHTFRRNSAHQAPEWFHFWLEENRWEDLQYIVTHRNDIKKWTLEEMAVQLEKLTNL